MLSDIIIILLVGQGHAKIGTIYRYVQALLMSYYIQKQLSLLLKKKCYKIAFYYHNNRKFVSKFLLKSIDINFIDPFSSSRL